MRRRIPNRSKFERFLRHYGVARMAAQLQIDESACYHWLRGVTRPKPEFAATIHPFRKHLFVGGDIRKSHPYSISYLRAMGRKGFWATLAASGRTWPSKS